MGMFDMIVNELYCPYCGNKQSKNDFQTKDFGKHLSSLNILEIKGVCYEIYHICNDCNNWIQLHILGHGGIHTLEEGKKRIKKKNKEIKKMLEGGG